ncbi:MAG: hypothetical protein A2Y66_01885 [Nitrospirae bacterium RBG_13_41_22]|nr:MAG: hypothetical protein A2Y66_01885 [Nitrospirae bacterium RBG_13_41_22]
MLTFKKEKIMLYQCELSHKGFIKERFFREGDSSKKVKEGLEMFDFGLGEWDVFIPEDFFDDYED